MSSKRSLVGDFHPPHGSLRGYVIGFSASVVLTLAAYGLATSDGLNQKIVIGSIAGLAIVQCVLQLILFLHLGNEFKPRWKLWVFGLMVAIVLIVVIGSLWIMDNLNYRMMNSPKQLQEYVESQDGL